MFSEDVTLLLTAALSCLILYISLKHFWRKGNLPPGQTPLPILGNVLQLGKGDLVKSLLKLSEKYGEVFTIYLGSRPVIVVAGYKAVREVYVDRGEDFLARGDVSAFDIHYKNYGIAFTSHMDRWRKLRRFSLSAMRDFSMGKRNIQDQIQEEAECLVEEFKKTKESLVEPRHYLSKAACNIIFSIMFGHRQDYEDAELLNVISWVNTAFAIVSSGWGQVYEMFPSVMQFIPGRHQKIFEYVKNLLQFVEERAKMNKKALDVNNPQSYVDAFLIKMEKVNGKIPFIRALDVLIVSGNPVIRDKIFLPLTRGIAVLAGVLVSVINGVLIYKIADWPQLSHDCRDQSVEEIQNVTAHEEIYFDNKAEQKDWTGTKCRASTNVYCGICPPDGLRYPTDTAQQYSERSSKTQTVYPIHSGCRRPVMLMSPEPFKVTNNFSEVIHEDSSFPSAPCQLSHYIC
ncbi:cytochrome P450 2G1-like [Leptodactylus fuscus]|uniref:cytochrome P450 2G1-like n=1 Tax=Leptodactylus fuscus TaxID=238119 RepID=UPI003F4EB1C5